MTASDAWTSDQQPMRGREPCDNPSSDGEPRDAFDVRGAGHDQHAAIADVCGFCKGENPPGSKFCAECGSPLHLALCEACGAVNSAGAERCWSCGHASAPQRAGGSEPPIADGSPAHLPSQQPRIHVERVPTIAPDRQDADDSDRTQPASAISVPFAPDPATQAVWAAFPAKRTKLRLPIVVATALAIVLVAAAIRFGLPFSSSEPEAAAADTEESEAEEPALSSPSTLAVPEASSAKSGAPTAERSALDIEHTRERAAPSGAESPSRAAPSGESDAAPALARAAPVARSATPTQAAQPVEGSRTGATATPRERPAKPRAGQRRTERLTAPAVPESSSLPPASLLLPDAKPASPHRERARAEPCSVETALLGLCRRQE